MNLIKGGLKGHFQMKNTIHKWDKLEYTYVKKRLGPWEEGLDPYFETCNDSIIEPSISKTDGAK